MPSKIRILSDASINKIAAGEVIENPASVVKELVENALDANATEICVEIKGGGRQLIRVTDNGCGMSPDDALLCLERHATSKITDVHDIQEISTLGFRGEAIPSIASISKFMLLTCPHFPEKKEEGTIVLVEGGKILKCTPAACSPGTTIEIKSLFFNVPVRKKFQKSPAYDTAEIQKMLTLLALGHPTIKFQLISNGEILLNAGRPASQDWSEALGARIGSILGSEFFQSLCPIENKMGDLELKGFIGMPACTRHNRTGQYLFINGRGVFSPLISYAVREGYGPTLGTHRHPLFVLHLNIPATLVDVNVHPQKREVRLRNENLLKDLVIKGVESALQKEGVTLFEEFPIPSISDRLFTKEDFVPYPSPPPFASYVVDSDPENKEIPPAPFLRPSPQLFEESPSKRMIPPKVITTLPGYFLLEPRSLPSCAADSLCLVDQRKAHFRIIFEKLENQEKKIETQSFLIPYTLQTTPEETNLLKQHVAFLNEMGVGLKEFGTNTFAIDFFPAIFDRVDPQEFIYDLINKLREFPNSSILEEERWKAAAQSASRAAVSSGKKLNLEEAQGIINQLMECQNPYLCPLGKETIFQIKLDELIKFQNKASG